jgi:hypothetical protein
MNVAILFSLQKVLKTVFTIPIQMVWKYYQDRQELVLHTREIYDTFSSDYPNWKTMPIESIIKRLTYVVKDLPRHTNINSPFGSATQKNILTL